MSYFDIILCERKNIGKYYVKAPAFCGANIGDVIEFKGVYKDHEFITEGKVLFVATTSKDAELMNLINLLSAYYCTATAIYSRKQIEPEAGLEKSIEALHALTIKKEEENDV